MKTILVVDDEFGFAEALSAILSDDGYHVFISVNGQQALERIPEIRPQLIVLDFMMPVMAGPATLEALRKDPSTSQISVIMVSGVEEDTVRQYTTAYNTFLRKPFRVHELMRIVRDLIGGNET
ncbi:MAG: response regulator [Clostridia bacterium]|nr:response regulator [Deltaproteobacteria bacterium]